MSDDPTPGRSRDKQAPGVPGRYDRPDGKRKSALRHWSTYTSVGEWFRDYRGYVPIQMAVGLSRHLREHPGMTFPSAYAALLAAGAIIELHEEDTRRD